ncbi:MAG: hypothetical protein LH650_12525 [Chloroflexi bacterium]|nr:hypothetical protein [Chloroflexota bacterium]
MAGPPVRDLVAVPDGGLDIATTLTGSVAGGLTQMAGQLVDVQAAANRLDAEPAGDDAAAAELATPMIAVPPAGVERLQAIDERMIQIDASVNYLSQLGVAGLPETRRGSTGRATGRDRPGDLGIGERAGRGHRGMDRGGPHPAGPARSGASAAGSTSGPWSRRSSACCSPA